MKKLTLLLAGLAIAITATAGVQVKNVRPDVKNHKFVAPTTKMVQKSTNRMNAIVSEQPAGELKTYKRAGESMVNSIFGLSLSEQSGKCYIVYAEDGQTIYMKDPLSGYTEGAWVEGTIEGDIISIPLGQSVYYSDYYQADVVLRWATTYTYEDYNDDGELTTYIGIEYDDRATVVEYQVDGDVITMLGSDGDMNAEFPNNYCATGLTAQWTDDDSWSGNMDWETVLTLTENYVPHGVIMDQPEGEMLTYTRGGEYVGYDSYYGYYFGTASGKVNVVWGENNKVYIQDPFANVATGAWVEGTIENNIITVPMGQFIYESIEGEWGAVMGWGTLEIDEEGYVTEVINYDVEEAQFAFDPENGTITLLDCTTEVPVDDEGYVITPTNITGLMCYYSDDLSMVELDFGSTMKELHLVPAVPANPTADEWYDCGDESGFSKFYFTLPTEDVNGNPLDAEYISYSIFTDNDQLFTFSGEDYTFDLAADEELTEVPYSLYSNAVDFKNYFIYMYRTNAEGYEPLFNHRIGIQVYYTIDGVKNASDIVYLEVFPDTKVNEINAGKTVSSVRYFNVAGQEMAQPEGLTIQVTTYTDGTTSATKVVK
ncbi:MAG: hypothetical protein IKW85_06715 [Muribaculaceae bacterium]|nr:hypothetical protein [Muribaculaceae bacterium]